MMNGLNDDPSHRSLIESSSLRPNPLEQVHYAVDVCYPLSHGQRALWFVQQFNPESVAHNIVYAVRLLSEVDFAALQRSVDRLIERHPVLRTAYVLEEGEPTAQQYTHASVAIERVDIAGWSQEQLDRELKRQMFRPFALDSGPLMRVITYSLTPHYHICLLSMHHIITDMWSVALFLMELGEFYTEETTGKATRLRPLTATYRDYVLEQNALLAGPEGERMAQYWAEKLANELPPLDLITDFLRPAVQTDHGDAVVLRFENDLVQSLKKTAEILNTSLHNLVLAAYQILLSRYSGQENFRIGYPKFGRGRSMSKVMGYFINPVVLSCDLQGDPTFRAFLQRVETEFKETSEFDTYPFRLVVELVQPERDLSRSPIFQNMFAWQKTTSIAGQTSVSSMALGEEEHGQALDLGILKFLPYNMPARVVPFDLTLLMAETEGDLCATVEYKTDLFKKETIMRFLQHFVTLLASIASNPDCPVSGLSILPEAERLKLAQWNLAQSVPLASRPVFREFEKRVEQTPQAVALEFDDVRLSYVQLNAMANQMAHYLRRRGLQAGELVGVCLPRTPDLVAAVMAVMKAGGGYLPFDANYPGERIQFMAADAGIRLLITHSSLLHLMGSLDVPVICLDSEQPAVALESSWNLDLPVSLADPAYVIYTSGSTGTPKGVLIAHGPFAGHCQDVGDHFGIQPDDRVLQFTPVNFDPYLEQIFTTLTRGATLILRGDALWEPGELIERVIRQRLTMINLTPAYWHQVIESWAKMPEKVPAHVVRLWIIGGDVFHPESLKLWAQTPMRGVRLLNAYGPTEAIITALTFEAREAADESGPLYRMPIGRPFGQRKAHILDAVGHAVPIGVPGELYLGGPYLADRYLGHAELTAERFVPDPFAADLNARLYRTGDRARWLPDGNIEFLGRVDQQVKVRGYRIEPGEIEAVLCLHPAVRAAQVIVRPGENGENQLAAYLVSRGEPLQPAELRQYLGDKLPVYMVPTSFAMMDAFPLTSSGKVDRNALRRIKPALAAEEPYAAPRDPVEEEITRMWMEVLKVGRVGVYDNFFALGGHSLAATRLVSRIRQEFQTELPLQSLFENPTVAGVAEVLKDVLSKQAAPDDLEAMLAELEGMSDEDAKRLLDEKG